MTLIVRRLSAILLFLASNWAASSLAQSASPSVPSESSSQAGQRSAPADQSPQPDSKADAKTDSKSDSKIEFKKEEQQRLLGVIPAFNVVMNGHADPLTPGQKFHLFFKSAVDPAQFGIVALDAGVEQAQNEYPSYGQGFKGYARRYGASYADDFDGNLFGNAILPSLLHQDPRYFRLGHGTFKQRLGYTLLSTVRCKGDNGRWQFNVSNVTGNLIGGALSNLYYPAADRGAALTIERGLTVTAEGAIGSFAVEFYPDAIAFFKRHHHHSATPAQ